MTDEMFDTMEYYDKTFTCTNDSATQKRKFDEIHRLTCGFTDIITRTCTHTSSIKVQGFFTSKQKAFIEAEIDKILK